MTQQKRHLLTQKLTATHTAVCRTGKEQAWKKVMQEQTPEITI